jgi:tellurite methyltransferase
MQARHRDGARERWNERYSAATFEPFPDAPAAWLVEHASLLRGGGRALDVACGDGRNARYLASLGYAVDAVDVSDVAIDALRAAAPERAPGVRARLLDLGSEPLPEDEYDVVACFFYLQRDLFAALERAMRPGGWLLFETFARAHVDELGNRMNPDYVLGDNELLHAFPRLRVAHYSEGIVERRYGPRGVASLAAQRPAGA